MIIFTAGSFGAVNAQPIAKIPKVGIIAPGKSPQLETLRQGLHDLATPTGETF